MAPIGFLTAFGAGGGLNVNQLITTSITVSSSQNPSILGQSVTFTATITPSAATGNVQFNDTSTNPHTTLGTGTISGGHAIFTTTALSVGSHNIVAKYLGDTNNAVSISAPLIQTVNQVSTSSITSLSSNATSIIFGRSVTFTTTVTPSVATGTVQLLVNGVKFGSPVALSGGKATFTTSLQAGTYGITAAYSGGTTFNPSISNPLSITTILTITSQVSTHGAGNGDNDDTDNEDAEHEENQGSSQNQESSQNNNHTTSEKTGQEDSGHQNVNHIEHKNKNKQNHHGDD